MSLGWIMFWVNLALGVPAVVVPIWLIRRGTVKGIIHVSCVLIMGFSAVMIFVNLALMGRFSAAMYEGGFMFWIAIAFFNVALARSLFPEEELPF